MKRGSLTNLTSEYQNVKRHSKQSMNTLNTMNEIGKTIINLDILDNTNKIMKNKENQRKLGQINFIKEQEQILKRQLLNSKNVEIIFEDTKKSKSISDNFQVDVSSLYSTLPAQYPPLEETKQQNSLWQDISKTIIAPLSPQFSYFSNGKNQGYDDELNGFTLMKRRSNFSSQNNSNLDQSFDSATNSNVKEQEKKVEFNLNMLKDKENQSITEIAEKKENLYLHAISQKYIGTALKNKNQHQNKFRRIKLGSLEKEVKFKLIENNEEEYQLIQKNRLSSKIFLDKKLVIIENNQTKYPSYHPVIRHSAPIINLNIRNSMQFRNMSNSFVNNNYKEMNESNPNQNNSNSNNNKGYNKYVQFRSENVLDKQRRRNDIFLESILDHKTLKEVKELSSLNNRSKGQNKQLKLSSYEKNKNTILLDLNKITKDIRRKSCHCSECGDLTTKQKDNHMLVLENEKKSNLRKVSSINSSSPRKKYEYNKDQQDSRQTYLSKQKTNSVVIVRRSSLALQGMHQDKILQLSQFQNVVAANINNNNTNNNIYSSMKQLTDQQQNAIPTSSSVIKSEDKQQSQQIIQDDLINTYKVQQQNIRISTQQSNSQIIQNNNNSNNQQRFQTEPVVQQYLDNHNSKNLRYQPNKAFFYRIEKQKRDEAIRAKSEQQKYRRKLQSTSPNKNDNNNNMNNNTTNMNMNKKNEDNYQYTLNKAQQDTQKQQQRISEHIRRQIASQGGQRNHKFNSRNNNNINQMFERNTFYSEEDRGIQLKEANKAFMQNCQKSVYLKKLNQPLINSNNKNNGNVNQFLNHNRQALSTRESNRNTQILSSYIDTFMIKRNIPTRKSSAFTSKAYSTTSTFQSTKGYGFFKDKKYLKTFQDEVEQSQQ